jgi:hypothetical protein
VPSIEPEVSITSISSRGSASTFCVGGSSMAKAYCASSRFSTNSALCGDAFGAGVQRNSKSRSLATTASLSVMVAWSPRRCTSMRWVGLSIVERATPGVRSARSDTVGSAACTRVVALPVAGTDSASPAA